MAETKRERDAKGPPICPDHQIKVHQRTFGYVDSGRNIRFEREFFERYINGNPLKAETHRLGYENSEDALTWNVFACLAKAGRLSSLAGTFAKSPTREQPELILWGLPVQLEDKAMPKTFPMLVEARAQFERGIQKMFTEPDIMLYLPGRYLILIEAKFTSGNTIAENDALDIAGEKPKSKAGIISRYSGFKGPITPLVTDRMELPFFSQLYRNLVFATWMARELNVDWGLVNLVSSLHHNKHLDPTPFIHSVLPPELRQRFVRYAWESLHREHVHGRPELAALDEYMHYKSANCAKGLAI